MHTLVTEALVARLIPYRESDRIVHLVTREAGLVSAIVPGARKSQKRFSNLFDLANHVTLQIALRRHGMGRVESGQLINGFRPISLSATTLAAACHILELAQRFSAEDHADPELFDLSAASLSDLSKNGLRQSALRAFEVRLLAAAGLSPNLTVCAECKKTLPEKEPVLYVLRASGVLCVDCALGADLPALPASTRSLLRAFLDAPLDKLFDSTGAKSDLDVLARILPAQIEFHVGARLKALSYARRMIRPDAFADLHRATLPDNSEKS